MDPARLALDLVPPAALAMVSVGLGTLLYPRRDAIRRPRLALACIVCPLIYALGTAAYLIGGLWAPGAALGSIGVLLVPTALVAALHRERPWLGALWAAVGLVCWAAAWGFDTSHDDARLYEPFRLVLHASFVAGSLVWVGLGLYAARDATDLGPARRLVAVTAPLLGCGAGFAGLQAAGLAPRGPALPAFTLVASELALYLLIKEVRAEQEQGSPTWLRQALVLPLLGVGALMAFGLAANLRILPRAPGALVVSAGIATLLALGYGAFLPALETLIRNSLYPEAREAEERARSLALALEHTRERLRRAEQRVLVGELAAQVAHEIKNPLGPIKGYAAVIEREAERAGALSEKLQRGLDVIRAEVEVIDARARGLLELARSERVEPRPEAELDLIRLVDECARAIEREVETSWRARPDEVRVRCDPLLLRSILGNLLENALQAGARRVELALEARGPEWVLTLSDDGPGLPADAAELFRPFVTHRPDGTGLGLAIARGAARALHGALELRAGAERGAIAELRIPRQESLEDESPAPSAEPAEGGSA